MVLKSMSLLKKLKFNNYHIYNFGKLDETIRRLEQKIDL